VAQNQISLYVLYLNKVEYKLLSRMSEWLLCNAKWPIVSYIMARAGYILMKSWWWWCPLCSRPTRWVGLL